MLRVLQILFLSLVAVVLSLSLSFAWQQWGKLVNIDDSCFDKLITEAAERHSVPSSLVKAVIKKESKFQANMVGGVGEIGLMQIRDVVIQDWERVTGRRCPNRNLFYDPKLNIEVGCWYLGMQLKYWKDYEDCLALSLASYNAGRKHAKEWAPKDKRGKVLQNITYSGTKDYIVKVCKYKEVFEKEYNNREN